MQVYIQTLQVSNETFHIYYFALKMRQKFYFSTLGSLLKFITNLSISVKVEVEEYQKLKWFEE